MSNKFKTIHANISDLNHDLSNVRHPEKSSQKDVIAWMLEEHAKEIYNLAKDIADNGLNPIELPLVVKAQAGNEYVVVEGNRRLTALKLLANPNLAGSSKGANKFSRLKKEAAVPIPRKVQVVLAPSREEAMWVIDRRHNGQDEGRGVVPWNSQQKARAQRARNGNAGRYERALNVIDYAVEHSLLGDETPNLKASGFPITNLERLLADAFFIQHMGISFDENQVLYFDATPEVAVNGVIRVLQDILNGLSVTDIKNAGLRKKYLKKINDDLPNPDDILETPQKAVEVEPKNGGPSGGKSVDGDRKGAGGGIKSPRSKKDRRKRTCLIDTPISISEKITNSVYRELKGCELDSHPLAATCLLRVLLDHSMDHYIDKKKIALNTKGGRRATLTEKIKAAAEGLKASDKITTANLKKIKAATSGNGGISDPENLHLSLHSRDYVANKTDLIDIWDGTYEPLIAAIWKG